MANLPAKLDLLLYSVEDGCDPSEYVGSMVPYMIGCLSLIEHRMPPVVSVSFQVSKDYYSGLSPLNSVSDAYEACWKELSRGHREMQLDDPDVSAIRAVICILYQQQHPESEDFLDSQTFFSQLVNNVEPHVDQEEALLKKHFASCLKAGSGD